MGFRSTACWSLLQTSIFVSFAIPGWICFADEVLVSDRITSSVYRYSTDGAFLGKLLTDEVNLSQPSGLQVSPDLTKLYVASSLTNSVVQYDYDFAAGTATNPTIFADGEDGLMFPNSILFSEDGNTIFVSNLGGSGIAKFNLDGSPAGSPVLGALDGKPVETEEGMTDTSIFQFSGLAHAPDGELVVGGFQNLPGNNRGAIGRTGGSISVLNEFIMADESLNGVGNLLVHDNSLYVASGFSGSVQKFDVNTGAPDENFTPIVGLEFPASLILAPDGQGFLVGALGFVDGSGNISRFDFDGTPQGTFATAQSDPELGFREATSMVYVAAPGLPGDYNGDGVVGAADYVVWRNNEGTPHDLNGNGDETGNSQNVVDQADYVLWRDSFGTTQGGSGTSSTVVVPEPTSILLGLLVSIAHLACSSRLLQARVRSC